MKAFLIRSLLDTTLRLAMLSLALGRAVATLAVFGVIFMAMVYFLSAKLGGFEAAVLAGIGAAVLILRSAFDQARVAILHRFFEPVIAAPRFDPRIPYSGCDGPTQFHISLR